MSMSAARTKRILASLKDFQRDTVDYVFRRMYEGPSPAMRFLIADEVGLGKTKVAAGIVARAVEHMKEEDPERRIDVIYVCSNAGIARQNISRLNVTESACHDLPDRITLLPRDISKLRSNKVNFIAFTPGTSLNLKSSGGKASERVLLFHLLPEDWVADRKGAISLLTGTMRRDRFKSRVEDLDPECLDQTLKTRFREALASEAGATDAGSLRERFVALADRLGGRTENLKSDDARERVAVVGALRGILAAVCIESLEPDLVILDEFQRFSDLLHGTDEASKLAQELFRHPGVRVLLLSATPYRMYATADEASGDAHYADLIQTIAFLQDDPERTKRFQRALAEYGRELYRVPSSSPGAGDPAAFEPLCKARDEVKAMLRQVMVRTERLAVTEDRSGMLKEVPCPEVRVTDRDVTSFLALQTLARSLGVPDVTEFWKSASYLVNFMDDYELKRAFTERLDGSRIPAEAVEALRAEPGALLSRDEVSAYCQLDPGNARLRNLVRDMLDSEAWRLLWIPPSWSYYEPEGEFASPAAGTLTKRLIFSSWQVVPKVVASLLSYEAERRMLGIGPSGEPDSHGPEARKKRRGLLRFSVSADRLTGMPTLGLLYPSFTLATEADPLMFVDRTRPDRPRLDDVLASARDALATFIDAVTRDAPREGAEDQRWYWAAPILIDLEQNPVSARAWLGQAGLAAMWRGAEAGALAAMDDGEEPEADTAWAAHVEEARKVAGNPSRLGRPPADLTDVVALNAVAGPAVSALRALARVSGGLDRASSPALRNQAGQVAEGLRSLFNQPEVTAMLRAGGDEEEGHWRRVLEYCARGGLQAVLDEYAHVLVEHLGVSGRPGDQIATSVSGAIHTAMTLRAAAAKADFYTTDEEGIRSDGEIRFRTRFAIRFGGRDQEDARNVMREGDAQKAFNSPFWPFILCSTSVGQEGLDFHLYCHAVMHWNLPSNPVDLEQREGRVHRYKGHAVRKNVASMALAEEWTYKASGPDSDVWRQLFKAARDSRSDEHSDLVPFWVYTTEEGAHIERHVPAIPLSRDVYRAEMLRRSLAVYRMAFGQSRQDDLVAFLQRTLTPEQIKVAASELRIDLTPDLSPHRHESGSHQDPGELPPEHLEAPEEMPAISLGQLEDLLNAFAAVRPAPKTVSADVIERLLADFTALRTIKGTGVAGWDTVTPT